MALIALALVILFAAAGFAAARESFRFLFVSHTRAKILRVADKKPGRAPKLAARLFGGYAVALYVRSILAVALVGAGIIAAIAPGGMTWPLVLFYLFALVFFALFAFAVPHSRAANIYPVRTYLFALERLPGVPERLKADYLVKTLIVMRSRHSKFFSRWLALAGRTFSQGELTALLSAAFYNDRSYWLQQSAFAELLKRDREAARRIIALRPREFAAFYEAFRRDATSLSLAAQLTFSHLQLPNRFKFGEPEKLLWPLVVLDLPRAAVPRRLVDTNLLAATTPTGGAPYRPAREHIKKAAGLLAARKRGGKPYLPEKS